MRRKPQAKPVKLSPQEWQTGEDGLYGLLVGASQDTEVTVLFYGTDEVGKGPKWHVHPYDEIFIIRQGHARYKIGDDVFEAHEGDILLGPKNVPHKFTNIGPGRLDTVDIHCSPEWIQTDLYDPEEDG